MSTAKATSDARTAYRHIVKTPGTGGGQPRIDGTRIRVSDIVARRRDGLTPEQIVSEDCYPSLSLAQVYSALAYYEDHRDEIEGYFRAASELPDRVARENPQLVRDLRSRSASE
jgi:uncharacterized protein (DUF433 family)